MAEVKCYQCGELFEFGGLHQCALVKEEFLGWEPKSAIHIDMTNMLMNLPVCTLVRLANVALNTMDMRTLGEVAFSAGIELDISFKDKING